MSCTFVEIQEALYLRPMVTSIRKEILWTYVWLLFTLWVTIISYKHEIFDDIDKIQGYRFIKPNLIFETRIVCDLWIEGTNLCYSDGYVKIKLFQWSC